MEKKWNQYIRFTVLFEFFYNGYKIFKESQNIDEIRLHRMTLSTTMMIYTKNILMIRF